MTIKIKFANDEHKYQYHSIEDVLELDNYNDIIYLDCFCNNLSSLSELPNSLTNLDCSINKFSSLSELPNSLIYLYCRDNNFLLHLK